MTLKAKTSTGIEISASGLCMVSARMAGSGIEVVDATQAAIAPETIQDGRVVDPVQLVQTLKAVRRRHKVPCRQATVSLSTECTVARMVVLSEDDPQKVSRFVRDEIRQYAALSGRETASDFHVMTPARPGVPGKALVVGADRTMVDAVSNACRQVGLSIGAIEPAVTAWVRLLSALQNSDGPETKRLFAICTGDALSLCILNRGVLDFVRTRSIGSPNASEAFMRNEIHAAIQFYDADAVGGPRPWHIVILDESDAGIGGNPVESVRAALPGDIVDIWTRQTLPIGVLAGPLAQDGMSAAALGSAIRPLLTDARDGELNLLAPEAAQAGSAGRTVLVAANALAVLMLVVILVIGGFQSLARQTARRIAAVEQTELTRHEPGLVAAISQLEAMEQKGQWLSGTVDALRSILGSRQDVDWVGLLGDIKTATPETVRITDLSVDARSDMIVEGVSCSYEAVHVFVRMLNRSPYVKRASLLETYRATSREGFVQYAVKCSLGSTEIP